MSKDRKRDVSNILQVKNNADNLESSALFSPPEFTPTAQPVQRQSISNKEKKVASKGSQSSNALPENLQQNMEAMSGIDLSDVSVHKNSSKPAQLQAEAYAQGSDIHLAPGKEQHLPHEAWHVVQQKQGRVQANTNIAGQGVNDSEALESEADKMGAKASSTVVQQKSNFISGGSRSLSAPVQMWNPFKKKRDRKRNEAIELEKNSIAQSIETAQEQDAQQNHPLAKPLKQLGGETNSDVYKAKTVGNIGSSKTNKGFAKRAQKVGSKSNSTTENLWIEMDEEEVLTENANLLARQVASSRLDNALGMGVTADEVFSKDENNNDIGITAMASGKQVRENQPGEEGKFVRNHFNFKDPRIQKGLSDLQLMDALTGQLDRHMGNIFIDNETGKVTGIDNDMSFHDQSALAATPSTLNGQWEKDAKTNEISYLQTQVDATSAEKIIRMDEATFVKVLKGKQSDAEHLSDGAIKIALTRFRAVKKQMIKLKEEGKLIHTWTDEHHKEAMESGQGFNGTFTNYMANAQGGYDNASYEVSDDYKRPPSAPKDRQPGIDNSIWPALNGGQHDESIKSMTNHPMPEKKSRNPFKRKKSKKQRSPQQEQYYSDKKKDLDGVLTELGF